MFSEPHQAAPWERVASESVVLVAQYTTYFNFTSHAATTGMGSIGPGPEQGYLLHSALALTTDGVPLGLVGQIAWTRDPETRGKSAARKQWSIEEKKAIVGSKFKNRLRRTCRTARKPCSWGTVNPIFIFYLLPPGTTSLGDCRRRARYRNHDDYGAA